MIALKEMGGRRVNQPWAERFTGKRIHLVGVGGSGMQALAGVLLRCGAQVSGSDEQRSAALEGLAAAGARIAVGQRAENLPDALDVVVYSAAVKPTNPELAAALQRGVQCVRYAEMVGHLMAERHGIAVAGTHGKSTTTAWVAYILRGAGLDPTFVVGADVRQLGGPSGVGDGPFFVAEACEYSRSFHSFRPRTAAILNVEGDHFDYYDDLDTIVEAFGQFAALLPPADGLLVVNADDPLALRAAGATGAMVQTFGLNGPADWQAANRRQTSGLFSFDLIHKDQTLGQVRLQLLGLHNVANALAAAAITYHCGVGGEQICRHLSEFAGATRRLTYRGQFNDGVTVVDDYAHHPTEVRATLQAARQHYLPRQLWAVFQPHQYSRTRILMDQFAESFAAADHVVLPEIYFARDTAQDVQHVSSRHLVERLRRRGKQVDYVPDLDHIVKILVDSCRPGDLVLTMGAGNIWKVADALVQRL